MSFWTAVVIIIAIGALVSVLKSRYNAQAGITEDMMGNQTLAHRPESGPAQDEDARREIDALKERIEVLERIAYDKNSIDAQERARISAEIDALREKQD